MKKRILFVLLLSLAWNTFVLAQTTTTTTTEETSSVSYFWAACEKQAVIDLDGTMDTGDDLYLQVFNGLAGTGTALTNLIRVPVDGAYQVSQTLLYNSTATLNLGQFASVRVTIARETDPTNQSYTGTIDDVQDGCIEPAYSSVDTLSATGSGSTTPIIDPETGQVVTGVTSGTAIRSSGVFTPDGGVLNEVFGRPQEAVVQIGARPSLNAAETGRTSDPGLIFAECEDFTGAHPGRVYDTDNITVFWSWFAKTPEAVRDNIAKANYEVFLSSPYAWRQEFPNVVVTPVVQREDENYWVFFVANLGTGFRPGQYRVDFYVSWSETINDGYEDFGVNTATPYIISGCTFNIEINPNGGAIQRNNPTVPLQQN